MIEKRKPLTRIQFAHLMLEQDGICGCGCGVKMSASEGIIDEHRVPLALGGSNDLENRHLFRKPCAKAKTVGDLGRIGKARRQARETGPQRPGAVKRQIPARVNAWPPKGSVKLQSRPMRGSPK